jgi:NADH-quinone oxidoreductase subunit H
MKFAVFFMGEYAAMFIFGGVFATLFLGGYNILPVNWDYLYQATGSNIFHLIDNANYWLAPIVFLGKCFGGITFFIWLRATLPRLRYDQLMNLGWKSLLPLSVANFITVGIWIIGTELYGPVGGWAAAIAAMVIAYILYLNILSVSKKGAPPTSKRTITMVSDNNGANSARRSVALVDPKTNDTP